MKSIKIISVFFFFILLLAGSVYAKDLSGRLGVGFSSPLSGRNPNSISAKYWLNDNMGFQGIFGFVADDYEAGSEYDEINFGGKVLFKIKDETNMHVDAFGGLGLISRDYSGRDDDTGYSLSGGLAIEYFFNGLPNLGFSSEIGLAFSDIDDNSSFGTTADTFITAGIHYYFDIAAPRRSEPIQQKE